MWLPRSMVTDSVRYIRTWTWWPIFYRRHLETWVPSYIFRPFSEKAWQQSGHRGIWIKQEANKMVSFFCSFCRPAVCPPFSLSWLGIRKTVYWIGFELGKCIHWGYSHDMINFWSCSVKYILFLEFRILKLKGIYIYVAESCFTDIFIWTG